MKWIKKLIERDREKGSTPTTKFSLGITQDCILAMIKSCYPSKFYHIHFKKDLKFIPLDRNTEIYNLYCEQTNSFLFTLSFHNFYEIDKWWQNQSDISMISVPIQPFYEYEGDI